MSFILNALRKSEQERLALQPESVTDRILLPQPHQKHSKATRFLVVLVVGNALAIIGIVWFIRNNSTSVPDLTMSVIPKSSSALEKKPQPKVMSKVIQPEKPNPREESESTSIADLIEAQQPINAKKPATDTNKQASIVNKRELPLPNTEAIQIQPIPPKAIVVKNDIPFLSELPVEFRQIVPKFNINVFVYAEHPEERFVMIDMVKYKPGQQIKDVMLLKEILPVSLIVVYQNKTFQIARP